MIEHSYITDDFGNLIRVIKYYSVNGVFIRMTTHNEHRRV